MQEKRRWLPRWQRVELVEKCLLDGLGGRMAARVRLDGAVLDRAHRQASEQGLPTRDPPMRLLEARATVAVLDVRLRSRVVFLTHVSRDEARRSEMPFNSDLVVRGNAALSLGAYLVQRGRERADRADGRNPCWRVADAQRGRLCRSPAATSSTPQTPGLPNLSPLGGFDRAWSRCDQFATTRGGRGPASSGEARNRQRTRPRRVASVCSDKRREAARL